MTGDQLVRTFVLATDADVMRFMAFMKANRKPMADQGRLLQVVVSEHKERRSDGQNAYMWAGILEPVAQQAFIGGTRYKAEVWHEFFKELYLPETNSRGMDKWQYLPNGSRRLMMGTQHLNRDEMAEYLTKIAAHAANELGVQLPANPREL